MSIYFLLCFAFCVKNSKIEYDPHFWGGESFWKIGEWFAQIPCGSKISTKLLYLTRLRRYKQFCVLLFKKIVNA